MGRLIPDLSHIGLERVMNARAIGCRKGKIERMS